MMPINIVKLPLIAITITLLLNGCGGNGVAKEDNNTQGVLNTPPVAKNLKTDLNKSVITQIDNTKNTSTKEAKVDLTIQQTATVKNLELKVDKLSLNKDTTTKLELTPTLSKGKVTQKLKDALKNPEFIVTPKDAIKIDSKTKTITALKDTNVTIQAKIANTLSNPVKLNIYWEVNGHPLPPVPDPKVNNATLLGVDSNNNGVRDDVERWIYEKYKDKHPIYMDITMQAARDYKLILEKQPKTQEEAQAIMKDVDKAIDCQAYYKYSAKYHNEPLLIKNNAVNEYFRSSIYFNTSERYNIYNNYDSLLSGDSYTLQSDSEQKAACDFDTSKYKE